MTQNNRFNNRIRLNQDILAKIGKIDEFKGLWQGGLRLSPQILGRLKSWVVITSAGASTRIEGAKMTDEEIARFLRGFNAKAPTNRDEQEVAGYADLIGRIFDNYKALSLTENWILQFHNILLGYSDKDRAHKGKYKTSDNVVTMASQAGERVVLFEPTPAYLVRSEMEAILSFTNGQMDAGEIHPILVIANFIFEFLAIHPFQDGNGRMSRALTNLLLLKMGYGYISFVSLDEIIEASKAEYYLALRATQKKHKTKDEDITPWVNYLLDALLGQAARARRIMDEDQPEKLLSENQLRIYNLFGVDIDLSVSEVGSLLKSEIPNPTVKQSLARLVKLKLLERIGQARSTRYRKILNSK